MDEKILKCDQWLERNGPREAVVVSTRARYARNFPKVPFPPRAREHDLSAVLERVGAAVDHQADFAGGYRFYLNELSELERQYLREAHLISADMEKQPRHRALFLSANLREGIMVNEEDHLRLFALEAGLRAHEALRQIMELEAALARELPFAFSPRFGYLTSCTTNTGTGLRVSALLHLPALSITGKIRELFQPLHARGMTWRGFYGENTENFGGFFQVSNEVTLGRDEEQIVEMFLQSVERIIDAEEEMRQELSTNAQLIDRVWRAYGILTHAQLMSTREAMELLAFVRLGIDMRLFRHLTHGEIHALFVAIQPGHIRARIQRSRNDVDGEEFTEEERDRARAQLLRERLRGSA
jgi:protein arginine kinase